MTSLIDLAEQFKARPRSNPAVVDKEARVNEFLLNLQSSGADLGKWTENEWILALRKLGLNDEEIADSLENVAGWGVVDNFSWESK